MPVQPCRERTSGLVGAGSRTKAFSAFTTSALAKCWPARCWARSHSRPRATRRAESEVRTHTSLSRKGVGRSPIWKPGQGVPVFRDIFTFPFRRKGVGPLGSPATAATLRPDSAQLQVGVSCQQGWPKAPDHARGRLLPCGSPSFPPRPCCQMPLSILAGLSLDPKKASSNLRPKSGAPGSQSRNAGPTSGPSHPEVRVSRPSVLRSRTGPGATLGCKGSPVRRPPLSCGSSPWKSGWKSHSQKAPKWQCSEVRSQAAAAAETNPSNPRSEPQGRQPRVAAAIRVRPEPGLDQPPLPRTTIPGVHHSVAATVRRLQLPAPL